jgi:hypothetical protein
VRFPAASVALAESLPQPPGLVWGDAVAAHRREFLSTSDERSLTNSTSLFPHPCPPFYCASSSDGGWEYEQQQVLRTSLAAQMLFSSPPTNPLAYQIGAISHMSSFFGGSGGQRRPPGGNRIAQGVGLLGAASVLMGKTKYVLAALKVTKLASLGSMLVTVGTYSLFFGPSYAFGMVGIYETGNRGVIFVAVSAPVSQPLVISKQNRLV